MLRKPSGIFLAISVSIYIYSALVILSFSPTSLNLLNGAATIYDRSDTVLRTVYQEQPARHVNIPLSFVPANCVNAVIATEDRWFWSNLGIDAAGLTRLVLNVVPFPSDSLNQGGGSTITQQLIKLGTDRVIGRNPLDKVNESLRAVHLTALVPKEQILEAYLNNAYYGNFIYGIEMASQAYFAKPVNELDLAECAYLAGLPQSPSVYNPSANLDKEPEQNTGLIRQQTVLDLMLRHGFISPEQHDAARAQTLTFQVTDYEVRAPHFIDLLAHDIEEYQPEIGVINWNLPYDVNTTYDYDLHTQLLAELKTEVEETGAADGAVIVLASDGAVRAAIGSTQFFTPDKAANWLQDDLPNTETSLWDYALATTSGKLKPYFVTSLGNRATQRTSTHIKQLTPELPMPDLATCGCRITTTDTPAGTEIKVLIENTP
jgi:membrane peptidoglycan carboxypeptidase